MVPSRPVSGPSRGGAGGTNAPAAGRCGRRWRRRSPVAIRRAAATPRLAAVRSPDQAAGSRTRRAAFLGDDAGLPCAICTTASLGAVVRALATTSPAGLVLRSPFVDLRRWAGCYPFSVRTLLGMVHTSQAACAGDRADDGRLRSRRDRCRPTRAALWLALRAIRRASSSRDATTTTAPCSMAALIAAVVELADRCTARR